jgi:hypothetical protein
LTSTPPSCKIQLTTTKGKKMETVEIGQEFTTKKSGYTGVVTAIIAPADNGHTVLELDNGMRYTTLVNA